MKICRPSDRHEPRFNIKQWRYTPLNKELFDKFKKANPNIEIEYAFFKDTIISINEEIINYVMNNYEGIFLPQGMGRIYLALFPPKEKKINDKIIQETGIAASYHNFDSGGFLGKIVWLFDDTRYKSENLKYYGFVGCRVFKNRVSKAFRETPEKYVREAHTIRRHEFFKRKNNERDEINSQSSDQPDQNTEQGSQCGLKIN